MHKQFDNGWYFQDEEGYWHGPYPTREQSEVKHAAYLEKRYAKPCEGDLVEGQEQ